MRIKKRNWWNGRERNGLIRVDTEVMASGRVPRWDSIIDKVCCVEQQWEPLKKDSVAW